MTNPHNRWDDERTLCAVQLCPFFVEHNPAFADSTPEFPIAPLMHLVDDDHEHLDDHEPQWGVTRTLRYWHDHGPEYVRERFVEHPPARVLYAAVIEWPIDLADVEPALILAGDEQERDREIAAEIRGLAADLVDPDWRDAIHSTDSDHWRDWIEPLEATRYGDPLVTLYQQAATREGDSARITAHGKD